ncbi:MAG: HesA/MoeB/ThiF family protein [Brevinematia bacterium]
MEKEVTLTNDQMLRYARHIILEGIGIEGQKKLLSSKVLVVGAGGLGSPVMYYLSAIGIGKIGIVENDVVELSNLQRQIIHDSQHIGVHKGELAKKKINALNPETEVELFKTFLDATNATEIVNKYDVIIDCTDNLQTRLLLNDTSYLLGKPLVHGAVSEFTGQVSVFIPGENTPCYRCIYEEPSTELTTSCRERGILGSVAGVIGTIQATETIKVILGIGESLVGKLLVYEALKAKFSIFTIKKNSSCPLCNKNLKIKNL